MTGSERFMRATGSHTDLGIGFRKQDNAFLAVDDVAALQAAADRSDGRGAAAAGNRHAR